MEREIVVWVCPTSDCGNYYAASSAGDLASKLTGDRGINWETWPERAHPRSQCPDCEADRIPILVRLEVPESRLSA